MSSNPSILVSIIVPAYNIERYIACMLESALAQTHDAIEVIVVNDGSTDGTKTIAEAYAAKDHRIAVINQENKGVSAARNAGFRAATGAYLCLVDADDIMLPAKVASQLRFLGAHPEADFTYSRVYYFIDGADDIYRHDLAAVSGAAVYKKLLQQGNFIYTSTVFFRREVFNRHGGFDETLCSAEEFDYWLSLSQKGVRFLHQDEYLTLCRSRGDGLTSDSVTMYSTALAVLKKHFLTAGRGGFWAKLVSRQYLKTALLLRVSRLRKSRPSDNVAVSVNAVDRRSVSFYVNKAFVFLRKAKFSLTFRRIRDAHVRQYLYMIESRARL